MASIAVSLSGGRRLAGSLPHSGHTNASLRSSPSLVDMVKSKTSSTQRLSKQIRSEIELLRKIIHDKDIVIQSLQQQQEQHRQQQPQQQPQQKQQQQQQQDQSSMMTTVLNHVNGNNSRTSVNERQQVERRLEMINHDIDTKKAAIKNIRLSLQQTSVSDNIDSRIRQAETEYQLEREETNLLNLQDEKRTLMLRFGGNQWHRNLAPSNPKNCLFRIIQGHVPLMIISTTIQYESQNPSFKLQYEDNQNHGNCMALGSCTVQWARDDLVLRPGDKLLEINGQLIPGRFKADVMKGLHSGTMEVVVARQSHEESYQTQIRDLTSRIERLNQEHSGLKSDNLRLGHRISYLEEIRDDLEMRREAEKLSAVQVERPKTTTSLHQGESLVSLDMQPIQKVPVRQKPPRNSKLKISSVNNNQNHQNHHSGSLDSRRMGVAMGAKLEGTSVNSEHQTLDSSVSRIKTSSIVDRHFGHVIRVTHHHHPHDQRWPRHVSDSVSDMQSVASFDSFSDRYPTADRSVTSADTMSNVSLITKHFNQRRPPSPTRSEVQSVQSVDSMDVERRHLGYISDGQTISSSYSDSMTKKAKPVPPRKPSFLYLNRTCSLQSVSENQPKGKNQNQNPPVSVSGEHKSNGTSGKNVSKSSLSANLKWNILSSSRSKSGAARKDDKERVSNA